MSSVHDGGGTTQPLVATTTTLMMPASPTSTSSSSGIESGRLTTATVASTATTKTGSGSSSFLSYYRELERGVAERESLGLLSNGGEEACDQDYDAEARDDLGDLESAVGNRSFNSANRSINSPDSSDSGILLDSANKGPNKVDNQLRRRVKKPETPTKSELPPGWEEHEDESGPYYWHVKTGTIQRATPSAEDRPLRPLSYCSSDLSSPSTPDLHSFSSLAELELAFSRASHSIQNNGRTPQAHPSSTTSDPGLPSPLFSSPTSSSSPSAVLTANSGAGGLRFALRSLGWIPIDEADLAPDRSSKSVNRCIVEMASARGDINDSVGKWGEGKDLYLEMGNHHLVLLDASNLTVLHRQPIITIKIWGVGRDNDRDFAYVARDRVTRRFLCHVFRCDTAARHLANALCAQCRQLMAERRQKRPCHLPGMSRHGAGSSSCGAGGTGVMPSSQGSLTDDTSRVGTANGSIVMPFPTPMEEPKKVIPSTYLGSMVVDGPGGLELLNNAIEKMHEQSSSDSWIQVSVEVAPSTITITDLDKPDTLIAECRVRFLSFMGISRMSTKLCGFIVHSAQDSFICHVLKCDPTAGPLCKTIEAACTLRYQKCLDAQTRAQEAAGLARQDEKTTPATTPSKSVEMKLRNVVSGVHSVVTGVFRRKSQA